MIFSASRIKLWMECALQAKFFYIDREPKLQGAALVFGTCIHYALECYNSGASAEEAIRAFDSVWANPELIDEHIDYWENNNTFAGMRQAGKNMLRDYFRKLDRWSEREVLFSERRFIVPFGRHILNGAADVGEISQGRGRRKVLKIGDYKTGKNQYRPYVSNLKLDLQFTIYAYASLQPEFWVGCTLDTDVDGKHHLITGPRTVEPPYDVVESTTIKPIDDEPEIARKMYETYLDLPRRVVWIQMREGGKEYDCGPRTDVDFMRLYRTCNEIEKAITAGVFMPKISGDTCGLCPYADGPCPMEIPDRETLKVEYQEDPDRW